MVKSPVQTHQRRSRRDRPTFSPHSAFSASLRETGIVWSEYRHPVIRTSLVVWSKKIVVSVPPAQQFCATSATIPSKSDRAGWNVVPIPWNAALISLERCTQDHQKFTGNAGTISKVDGQSGKNHKIQCTELQTPYKGGHGVTVLP